MPSSAASNRAWSRRVCGQIKPEPEIFEIAARRFEAEPAQLLFIDDVLDNVRAARQAGWQATAFRRMRPTARRSCARWAGV